MQNRFRRWCFLTVCFGIALMATGNSVQSADLFESFDSREDRDYYWDRGRPNDTFFRRLFFNARPWSECSQQAPWPVGRNIGLPLGRRYIGGRYFGPFNNRYYGPQYGNF